MENQQLMTKFILPSITILLLGACASNELVRQPTASGKPEQIINAPADQLQTLVLDRCNMLGFMTETSTHSVLCNKERQGMLGNAALSVAMGNRNYAAPTLKIRYTIVPLNNGQSRIYADYWVEMQGEGGFQHRSDRNLGGRLHNDIQTGLNNLKARFERQTTYRQPANQTETVLMPQ